MSEKQKNKTGKTAEKSAKPVSGNAAIVKQIDEVRNSAVALFNVLAKKGIMNEKEFMTEYKKVSASK